MKNNKFLSKILNLENIFSFFLIIYFPFLFFFVYKTSNTLPPFRDEIVSLTANVSFFLNGLNFEGPRNTIFEGLYNPFLTSPPLSAVGSSMVWKFTDNFNIIRVANFLWVLTVQIIFSSYIAKIYNLEFKKLIVFSGFTLVSFPFWFGSLYSLGETISIIIFFNSLFLYKTYPKTSVFLMGLTVFFGKGILIVLFIFFYIINLLVNKEVGKAPIELLFFLIPLIFWLLLIIFKSDYKNIFEYINHFKIMYESMGSQIGNLGILSMFSLKNIIQNFQNSGVLNWNPSVILRVFVPPVLLFFVLVLKKGKNMILETNQLIYFIGALSPLYAWYVLISPEKPIIYASHFTFPLLMYSCYLLSRKNIQNDLVNNSAYFICCLYMTSNILFLLGLGTLLIININKKLKYSTILILITLSLINSSYEVLQEKTYSVDLNKCKSDITSYDCYEYLMRVREK